MKIIVMMKQVANRDAILRINKDQTWIEESDLSFEVSESDGYALEEALRVREKLGGDVVVCSMGLAELTAPFTSSVTISPTSLPMRQAAFWPTRSETKSPTSS